MTTVDGRPLQGAVVGVQQSQIRTTTDAAGSYAITAPTTGVLIFSAIGYRPVAVNIAQRTTVDVALEPAAAVLDEIVFTGYTEQRRADLTGAVSSVDVETIATQSSSSVLKRLDGQAPGVTVDQSGSPGARTTVRIRGVSSFQNNDPLYIIDGTPIEDSYLNWLNPNDIESMQVLKDVSAASIYGSRAANGVVIIETRKTGRGTGEGPYLSVDLRTGIASPVRGYDDFLILDALEYHEVVKRSYENAGLPVPENIYGNPDSPTIPAFIWPNNGLTQTTDTLDTGGYVWGDASNPNAQIMPGSPGTNWWDAVFGAGMVADASLELAGAGASNDYYVSFNYYNQEGTAAFNRFQRASARVNTRFQHGRFDVGENLAVAQEHFYGGMDDPGGSNPGEEGTNLVRDILMQPVVPVYDMGGNYAGGKAVGLGVSRNPLKQAWANKDDVGKNLKIFGNGFAGFRFSDELKLTTRLGFNLNERAGVSYDPTWPEDANPSFTDTFNEGYDTFRELTWTNTLRYTNTFAQRHGLDFLLGQEAIANEDRYSTSGIRNLISTDINARYIQDALGQAASKNVSSSGSKTSLLSFFGKVDYNFASRYFLSVTVRRDGSSRLGPNSRWGTFPAFGVGWRLSQEPFFPKGESFTNVTLRAGYGVTGNQLIPPGRMAIQFGGSRGDTYYAVAGGNTIVPGYRQTAQGNPDLKWEETKSVNLGFDLEFFRGAANLVVDMYRRVTDDVLFDPLTPATAGVAAPPLRNIGAMRNTGIDFGLGYTGTIGSGRWKLTLNGSHYKNEILRIDGVQDFFYGPISTRFGGNQVINQVGHPIGAFHGLEWDGFFENDEAVADHAFQDGAAPGRIRFVDQLTVDTDGDGVPDATDGVISAEDRVIVGSPHPDFTAGLDFTLQIGAWDFSATLFGTFGNEIWNAQKEFYVFRNDDTNVRRDLLTDSWTPDNVDAKYPRLDVNDRFSGTQLSDYYVEDGSYVRLRTLQVGWRLPQTWIPNTRVYVQGENLFTVTGYSGLDPALPAANILGSAGDIRDQYRAVDRGAYPSSRVFSFGISARI